MALFLGCDPDRAGAIGFIDTKSMTAGTIALPADPKAIFIKSKDLFRARLDAIPLNKLAIDLMALNPIHLVIEQQQAYEHDSPMSAFTLGESYGLLCQTFRLAAADAAPTCQIHHVLPLDWKASFGLIYPKLTYREKKKKAVEFATKMFPDIAKSWALVKHTSHAEALLIALYGMAKYEPGIVRALGVRQPTLLFKPGQLIT